MSVALRVARAFLPAPRSEPSRCCHGVKCCIGGAGKNARGHTGARYFQIESSSGALK